MDYATDRTIGTDFSQSYPISTSTPEYPGAPFAVGTIVEASNGSEWVFVKAAAAITGPGYICSIDPSFNATMLTTALGLMGVPVGVAPVAVASASYFWLQRKGPASIQCTASAAANVALQTTATAGQVNSGAATGSLNITGLFLTTANGASAGLAPAQLNYPIQGTTN